MPKEAKAGIYILNLEVYEKDPLGEITNKGFANINIQVNQIPTSLEIVFENQEVTPGENLKFKSILHDQTGEKINSSVIMSIKNEDNKILEQIEKQTGEFLEFSIAYNEPPANWTVVAVSNRIISEMNFKIKEKKDVKIEIINKTIKDIGKKRIIQNIIVMSFIKGFFIVILHILPLLAKEHVFLIHLHLVSQQTRTQPFHISLIASYFL